MTRREKREIMIKVIYQINLLESIEEKYKVKNLLKEQLEEDDLFIEDTINGIVKNKKDIVELINKYLSDKWSYDRLPMMDQSILLLSIYEMLYTDTPNKVIIDEAIELSKLYSDEDMPKVINGVLDNIYHNEEKINE